MPRHACSRCARPFDGSPGRCPNCKQSPAERRGLGLTGARGSTRAWRKLRAEVIERDGGACVQCGSTEQLTVHHIEAKRRGGADVRENLITLCQEHHEEAERQAAA